MEALARIAEAAADASGAVIRRWFRAGLSADLKSDESPVTRADREAEAALRDVLRAARPHDLILGEEDGEEGEAAAAEGWRWVLDPIDGTRAFITGRPVFGTLIGLLHEGRPVLGVIDQPILGERWVGVARPGGGYATRFFGPFGGVVGTRRCARLADAELSATSPEMFGAAWPRFAALQRRVRRTSWGGDCYAYGLLALGQIDVVCERDLKIWDWAALVPVVEGAGGVMRDWGGGELRPGAGGDVVAVGDVGVLREVLRLY